MTDLNGRAAVITGGANGLGKALAWSAAQRGMNVLLTDIDGESLGRAKDELERIFPGVIVEAKIADISQYGEVDALARFAVERFGGVYAVFNNAGVGTVAPVWENTEQDWQWLFGVNVLGVAWGVKAFVPMLIAAGEGHIVNTASAAAWFHQAGSGVYNTTKAAVLALSETLANDLKGTGVGVSVVSPAYFPAGITDSERVRPAHLLNQGPDSEAKRLHEAKIRAAVAASKITAEAIAEQTFEAIESKRFYVFPHGFVPDLFLKRAQAAKDGRIAFDPNAVARAPLS